MIFSVSEIIILSAALFTGIVVLYLDRNPVKIKVDERQRAPEFEDEEINRAIREAIAELNNNSESFRIRYETAKKVNQMSKIINDSKTDSPVAEISTNRRRRMEI